MMGMTFFCSEQKIIGHRVSMTVYYICICQIHQKAEAALLCCRKLFSVVLITYLQALVGVAQAQLPAGHHGLLWAPGLSTDQTPALRPIRVWAQQLHAALVTGPSSCESDLCGAEGLETTKQSIDTQGPDRVKTLFLSVRSSAGVSHGYHHKIYFTGGLDWCKITDQINKSFYSTGLASLCIYRKHGRVCSGKIQTAQPEILWVKRKTLLQLN